MSKLSKATIVLIVIGIIVLGVVFWGVSTRNNFVMLDESVTTAWANVQTQYQRRADLIPNLVKTVKGYATHEKSTFTEVVEARAKATQITVDANGLTPEKMKAYQDAQGQLSAALGRLLAVAENYPQLKANENFLELQAQLEGTENRINESRALYNNEVQTYNVGVRKFPYNIVANLFGFQPKTKFEADANAQKAPEVNFD